MHVKGRHYLFFSSADSCGETRKLLGIVTIPQPAMSIETLISRRIEWRVGKGKWVEHDGTETYYR